MKIKKLLISSLYLLLTLCSSLHGQAPDSIVGQTITFNYQSTSVGGESGTARFSLFEGGKAWEYDTDDGEWESPTYQWEPSAGKGEFVIIWGELEYVNISLSFDSALTGTFTYVSWDDNGTGISSIEDEGIGDFVISSASEFNKPPFERYFSDDFTNPSVTRENFHFADGDTSQGLTIEQNSSGYYTIRGLFTGEEDGDNPHDRWFEISAKSLLPMNKSWVVEADFNLNFSELAFTTMLQYAHAALQLEFDSLDYGHFQIGRNYGSTNNCFANIYYDPINSDDINGNSAYHSWYPMTTEGNVTYRIINDADDYTLTFQYQVDPWRRAHGQGDQLPIITSVMELEWDDGSYVTYDPASASSSYGGNWKQIENWESIGDKFVQPSMALELPHRLDEDYNSGDRNLTLIELQGGEIGFRRFSVHGDPEIIYFDDGDDVPSFYNKLATEVGQVGSSSRYHLLKGLHALAQLVESTESDSLKQFAVSFGVEDSILDFSLADSPLAGTYEFELDREFHIGKLTAFAQNSLIPRLESIDNHFAQVTDVVTMETSMTGAEEEIIADATDVKVLRAMVNLLASLASLQSGYDWDLSVGYLQDLDMEVTETDLEEFRERHPGFLGVRSVEQLQKAQTFLQTAISVYKEASKGLRSTGRYATQADWFFNTEPDFLFVLDEYDFAEESEFIADLEELYDALSNDYKITDDEEYSGTIISLDSFFNGGLDIPQLLPESVGDQFASGDLKDPTLGGILPEMSYDSGLVVQDLREGFFDSELVKGYERHESREEALKDFDYLAYLSLNPDLGKWYQTEVNARNHFYNRGFLDERRYFLYPYETGEQPPNHAADSLAGHKATSIGIIPEFNNYQFSYVYYFIDDVNVIVKDEIENTWEKNHYIYRRTGFYSAELILIPENAPQGEKIITSMSFTSSERQGTDGHKESGDIVVSIPSPVGEILQGNGAWECWHLDNSVIESEIPLEYRLDQELAEDYAPYSMTGKGDYRPRIEFTSSNGGGSIIFDEYMGINHVYYFKDGKNSAKISQTIEMDEWDLNSNTFTYRFESGTLYHLSFTGENNGTYAKYEKSASYDQPVVDSGSFTIHDLAETSRFAWELYDNFEEGTLDPENWETGYFSGGQEPKFISDNVSWPPQNILELKGDSYTGSSARKIPAGSFWEEVNAASQSAGDSNTAIFIQDPDIIGVQAKIRLNDYTYSENGYSGQLSNQAGVYIAAPPSQLSIELVWREYQDLQDEWGITTNGDTYFSYYEDAILLDPTNGKRVAHRPQWYTVSLVRLDGKISYFIDGNKISEFTASDDLPLQWMIGAFNDNGQPFSAYVDDVRVLRRSDIGPSEPEVVKIKVSGGSPNYPHYTFSNSDGDVLDMQEFEFQPDTKYRFIAENLNVSHPFTIGVSINGSEIIKFTKITPPDLPEPEEHNFTGVTDDLEVLGNDLLMPPIELDFGDDYVLSLNGDYFDFEYSKELLSVFKENDVKLHYLCDFHSTMNGLLHLPIEEEIEQYPVVWLTPEIFSSVTGTLWEWTSFANFHDPELGQGGYFALANDLIFVPELIESSPGSKKSVWLDVGLERYQYFSDDLINQYNLTIEGYYQPARIEDLMAKVEGFLEDFRNGDQGNVIDNWVTIYHAEKLSDMLDPDRCIYKAELSNDVTILFNQNGEFVHSTPTSFGGNEYKNDYIPEELVITVVTELPGSRILELWDEVSHLEDTGFVYRAVVESNSTEFYEIYLNKYADKIHLVTRFYGEINRDFPEKARSYMAENYRWEDGYEMYYSWWFDEPTGNYYAQLDDGIMVIFDQDGIFKEEVGLTVPEVKLSFNADRSSWGQNLREPNFDILSTNGQTPAYINVKKLKPDEFSSSRRTGLIAVHDMNEVYSASTVIIHNGVTYLSLKAVPAGTPVTSIEYWTQLEDTSPTENPGEPPANDPDSDDINGINPPEDGGQNQAPQISDITFEVTENSPIGTLIGQVIASDPDGAGSLSYSLHSGVESLSLVDINQDGYLDLLIEQPEGVFSTIYNESGTFQTIEQLYPQSNTGGEVSVNNLFRIDQEGSIFTDREIDFEELGSQVSLGVTVSDEEGAVSFKKLTVSILPPPPVGSFEGDIFQISFTNSVVPEDADIVFSDLELGNTDLPAQTPLKLTFNYEEGDAPQYIIVSGANVRGFKHIYPQWDPFLGQERPGSFTILADTVDPVVSTDGDLNSTFGMIVVMGGERWYGGAIFEANVPIVDLGPAEISDPWSSAAFSLAGKLGEDTKVRAFLPRNLLEWMGLPEFHRLKAGLAYGNGEIQFINGSFQNNEINGTGSGFYRLLHQGEEMLFYQAAIPYVQGSSFTNSSFSDDQLIEQVEVIDDFTRSSKFDFNGDGAGDDLLEVGFHAQTYPAEVQFGDFYIEETVDYVGEISGKVVDAETDIGLSDFGIWPFTVPYGIDGPRESNFEYDLEQELWNASGEFSLKLPAGEYYFEAWGYDVNSSDYYTTKVISNNGGPFVVPEDGNTSFDNLVVELKKEFVAEYVWISSKLVIEGQQGFDQINGVEIQLYLVDDNDVRISDYPNAWLWVEPGGSIYGEAPVGKSEVVLQSWDNSVKLLDSPVYWEVSNNDEQTLPDLYAAQAGRINVSGKIRDAVTQFGIWAEVVFVDPNDENNIFWPQWEPIDEPSIAGDSPEDPTIYIFDGQYSVSIPAGTYKIKASVRDGIHQSEYYISPGVGTSDFAQAESIAFEQDLTDIDFNLDSAPAAKININVSEQDTNASIPYAWFDFYDGYDEYGPVFFPQVDYSNSEDGNYTIKSSAGSYKVLIGSPDHDSVYLKTDIQGNYYWEQGWDWSSAALLEFTNIDVLDLPVAKLKSFGPLPPPTGGNSISGKVVTNRGEEVPKANVFAHTEDWIHWYETTSKGNGDFSFDGLPEGNWIVYADPPYDSEEFSSYRSSNPNWESPISLVGSTDKDNAKLVLQGSNVFGRILYPQQNENGITKLEPLANAFIWAFQDENQTGEPNYGAYVEGEIFTYNEAYGETNDDGYFSLYLPEAGKYSMRVELPWFMTNQEFAPIHFELRNTDQELVLGNTIRLDWKKAKIDTTTETFSIERKSDTQNNYKSLDSNKSKSLKSYLDTTVKPGKSYEYRVYEVASNGDKDQLSGSDLKVSKPFIYLAPSEKIINGEVKDQSEVPALGAEIVAWQQDGDGWANTFSDNSGKYELVVGPGKWEIMVYPPWETSADWNYNGAPKVVNFANNSSKVEKTANFTVERLSSSRGVTGQINIPEGKENLLSSIFIDVFKTDGSGNWANPQSDGNFSISLEPGRYELSVWLDPIDFAGYVAPESQWVRVGKGITDIGTIEILEENLNSGISGTVSTAGDETKTLANFEVWAWSENGEFAYTSTDVNGSFQLKLNPGRYEVGIEAPLPPDGSQSPYLSVPPKKVKVVADSIRVLNFQVTKAAIDVEGIINNSKGSPVLDSGAWVYAFSQNGDDYEFLTEMPVSSRGTFSFPGIPGTYSVGLWLPPGSDYIHPDEQVITVENGNDNPDKIIFTLEKANALISGKLINKETNSSIEDLVGEVYAMRTDGDGWRTTEIESDGSYSLILSPGSWLLDYYIEYDAQNRKYPKGAASPIEVLVSNGVIPEQNFVLISASASITGKVIFAETNASVTDDVTYIWAYRKGGSIYSEYWQEVETDDNGTFVLPVLKGGLYEIGASISPDLLIGGYLNPPNQFIKMDANSKTTSFSLAKPPVENFISGSVIDDQNQSLSNAYVYAWNYDGVEVSSYTNSEGDFNMSVSSGTIWYIGAEYSEFDENDNEVIYQPAFEVTANLQNQEFISDIIVILEKPNFVVPDGISVTFDPTKDFVTTLPDGTEITIPAGAVSVPTGQSTVRFVVSPSAKGLDKSGTSKPADYAYKMELFDEKGKEIEGIFKKDIIIKVAVDVESFAKKGIDLNTLEGMYYSTTKQKWEKVKTSTWDADSGKLTMTTDHFTGLTSTGQTAKTQLAQESTPLGENSGWFDSSWFGEFYDPLLSGNSNNIKWIYSGNEQLEWVAVSTKQSDDSYWFYHSSLEWLWISKEFFDLDEYAKSHIYIFSQNFKGWVFLDPNKGIWNFSANNGAGAYID